MADFQNTKTGNTDNRTEMAPVADYTDKRGNVIPAGTIGTLSYVGGSRGWSFYTNTCSWNIKAGDLFRFVKASEIAGVVVGSDLTSDESARFLTNDDIAKWSKTNAALSAASAKYREEQRAAGLTRLAGQWVYDTTDEVAK